MLSEESSPLLDELAEAKAFRDRMQEHFREAGRKGGKTRARKLSARRRSEIGRAGARARWGRAKKTA